MDEQAENGIAAHFIYKEKRNEDKQLNWVKELRELNLGKTDKPEKFLETIKINFFKNRIFIFTPMGDIIDLPEGSSVIDFAYAIHTDIGYHAQGALVNGKNVALNTKLKTHDIVEIQTNKNAKPSSKWLDYAKTSLAKREINSYLKDNSLLSKFLTFGKN
jgi:GTP diphosphokinase / guanosine-3',5'-bis(diphosphate) 3'-diphosphatase